MSISEEIGTQSQSNRGNVSKQLQAATNTELPRSQEVEAVITQEVTDSQSVKVNCPVFEQLCVVGQGLRTHLSRKHKSEYKELKKMEIFFNLDLFMER